MDDFVLWTLLIFAILLFICIVFGTFFDCLFDHAFHFFNVLSDYDSYFCIRCGDQLRDFPVVCPCCFSELSGGYDFCPNCGGALE